MRLSELLVLIKNLSKSERQYFRAQAAKQEGKATAYLELYEKLERIADAWDPGKGKAIPVDSVLEKKLRQKNSKGPTQVLKNYLSQALFKSLRQLHDKNNRRDEIEAYMKNARILENRGLLNLAADHLNKALKLALDHEYHALAYDVIQHLIRIETQADVQSYAASIGKRLDKIIEITRFLDSEASQFAAYYRTFLQFRLGMASGMSQPVDAVGNDAPILTFSARMYHYQLLSMQALMSGNAQEARKDGEKLLYLWETAPGIKKERLGQYIRHFSNYLNYCIAERSFEHFEQHLNNLKALSIKASVSIDLEAELEQNILLAEQMLYLNTDRLEESCAIFPRIEEAVEKFGSKINRAREMTLRYNNVIALFALSQYEQALTKCLDLVNIPHYEHRRDLQFMGRVLEIIIHYELRDHQYLNTLVAKLGRMFKQPEENRDFERMILRNLLNLAEAQVKNLSGLEERKTSTALFIKFHNDLQAYKSAAPAKLQIGMEEIAIWVESKVQGKPFRDILKHK